MVGAFGAGVSWSENGFGKSSTFGFVGRQLWGLVLVAVANFFVTPTLFCAHTIFVTRLRPWFDSVTRFQVSLHDFRFRYTVHTLVPLHDFLTGSDFGHGSDFVLGRVSVTGGKVRPQRVCSRVGFARGGKKIVHWPTQIYPRNQVYPRRVVVFFLSWLETFTHTLENGTYSKNCGGVYSGISRFIHGCFYRVGA